MAGRTTTRAAQHHRARSGAHVSALVAVLALACSGPAPSPSPPSGATPPSPPALVASPPSVPVPAEGAPVRAGPGSAVAEPADAIEPVAPGPASAAPPSPAGSLAALLPPAEPPITLAHARTLAAAGDYARAAAVYDALARLEPENARYLAGRGYCLIYLDGAGELARTDLVAAQMLAVGSDARLVAQIEHNLGRLEERVGGVRCADRAEAVTGSFAPTLVGVVAAIVTATTTDDWAYREPVRPTTEEEALDLLCQGEPCTPTARFVATMAPDGCRATHLVFPVASGGYRVVPNVTARAVWDQRCGEEYENLEIVEADGRVVVRSDVAHMDMFDECFDGECMTGCAFSGRTDVVTVVRADGSRAVRVTIDGRSDGSPVATVPMTFDESGVTVTVCDREQQLPF